MIITKNLARVKCEISRRLQFSRLGRSALLFIFASSLTAQTASVTGRVSDVTDSVIPEAQVVVTEISTGVERRALTNESGYYVVPALSPGTYHFTVQKEGFKAIRQSGIVLELGQTARLNFVLQLGEVTQAVEVTGEGALLQTNSASIGQLIERKTVEQMPLANRRTLAVVRLLGNMSFASEREVDGQLDFSMGGGRSRQEEWILDGGTVKEPSGVSGVGIFNPPAAAVREVKLEINGYPAEYGRTSSGIVSMVTKSGTNEFHGELYEFFRNDALDARTFFARNKAPRKFNVFGGTIGGPVRKDKTHFFFSYEKNILKLGSTSTINVPTRQEIAGDFSNRTDRLIDPLTRQPFPTNVIPTSRIDPVGKFFASLYPTPNVAGAASGSNNYRQNIVQDNRSNNYIGRVDHVIGTSNQLMARYLVLDSVQNAGGVGEAGFDSTATTLPIASRILATSWTHSSAKLFNDLRYTNAYRRFASFSTGLGTNLVEKSGLRGVPNTDGMAQITLTGLTTIGSGSAREFSPNRINQVIDVVSWIKGAHTVKFGGELRHSATQDQEQNPRSGRFTFNDVATGPNFSLAALLLGHVQAASLSNGVAFRTHTAYIAGFVQDEWKISPKLTVNYGLRWEMDTPRFEINNQQSGFDPLKINPVSGTPGVFTFAGVDGGKIHAHKFDLDNFGPRLGVAWSIGANTVIRAGYGLMIGPIYNSSSTRSAGQGFGDLRSFESPDNGVTPVFYLRDGMLPAVKEALGPAFGAVPVGGKVRQSGSFFGDPYSGDHENNEAHHFNLSIQRRVRGTLVLEGAYLANLGHHVGGASDVNINVVRPELAGATANQTLRPFPQFSTLSWVGPTYGNSSYHSLNLKAEKRYASGFNLLANYTWSKSIDDIPANPTLAGEVAGQDFYNRAADKSLSGSDIRHRMVGSFVYALPIGKGKYLGIKNPVADALMGGWTLGVIMELRSGSPFGVTESSNRLNTFGPVQRANIIGDPVLSSDRSRAELVRGWFNVQAFAFPGSGKLGNTARRLLTGPGFASADTSLAKNFRFSEKRYVELRADAFNLLNRPNFRLPSGRRGQADFGTISSTFDARSIALGLRIVY